VRTSHSRAAVIVAGLALIAAPVALAVPADAADPGNGTVTVNIVDDRGQPVTGMVSLFDSTGDPAITLSDPVDPTALKSSYTGEVPAGTYAVAVIGGWGLVGCAGLEPCGLGVLGGAPAFKTAAFTVTDQGTTTYTFKTTTPSLDAPSATVGSDLSVMTPPLLGSQDIGDVLSSLGGILGGVLDPKVTWLRDGKPIKGATGVDYTLTTTDVGHPVTAQVKFPPIMSLLFSSGLFGGTSGSIAPAPVTLGPVVATKVQTATKVSIAGKPRAGQRPNAWVKVTGAVDELNGWAQVRVSGLAPVRVRINDGFAQVRLPELMRTGSRTIKATFLGSPSLLPSSGHAAFKVRGARHR
jgi:uncharacterized protein (DUF2141 family)